MTGTATGRPDTAAPPPHRRQPAESEHAATAAHARQFGPYAAFAPPVETPPSDVSHARPRMTEPRPVANNNTSPGARRADVSPPPLPPRNVPQHVAISDKVIAMPGVQVQPQGVIDPSSPPPLPRAETHFYREPAAAHREPPADNVTLEIKTATLTAPAGDPRIEAALWRAGLMSRALTPDTPRDPSPPQAVAGVGTGTALVVTETDEADEVACGEDGRPEIRIDMISRRFAPGAGE